MNIVFHLNLLTALQEKQIIVFVLALKNLEPKDNKVLVCVHRVGGERGTQGLSLTPEPALLPGG